MSEVGSALHGIGWSIVKVRPPLELRRPIQGDGVEPHGVPVGVLHAEKHPAHRRAVDALVRVAYWDLEVMDAFENRSGRHYAVTLQNVSDDVKTDGRKARSAATEERVVAAATRMFIANGYTATTLADVADEAGIGARTLYLRFATKAELLLRCIGIAIAGDADDVPLGERDWMTAAMTAPSLEERIRRMASVTAQLMDRTGDILEVARQAAAVEPEIAVAAQAGRDDTRRTLVTFWQRAAKDGLLPRKADLEWLSETGALLAHADTYNLLRSTTHWDVAAYERWLVKTWERLAGAAASTQA